MADAALLTLTIAELVAKIKGKEVSPVELTEAALAQADRLQPRLNSFITILHEQARRQAREQEAALMKLWVVSDALVMPNRRGSERAASRP